MLQENLHRFDSSGGRPRGTGRVRPPAPPIGSFVRRHGGSSSAIGQGCPTWQCQHQWQHCVTPGCSCWSRDRGATPVGSWGRHPGERQRVQLFSSCHGAEQVWRCHGNHQTWQVGNQPNLLPSISSLFYWERDADMLVSIICISTDIDRWARCLASFPRIPFPETDEIPNRRLLSLLLRSLHWTCHMTSSVAKHYGCKRVKHCGVIGNGLSKTYRDFFVKNMNCCFARYIATAGSDQPYLCRFHVFLVETAKCRLICNLC